jgi:hypothetical protein
VSRNLLARRAGVLAVAVTAAVLGATAPAAAADVTVEPPSAAQGSGANVTFRVTNTAPAAITKVRLVLPKDTPVAEVFPLSVPDWAPQIENMKLAKPLTSIHGGTPVTETAAAISWIAVRGRNLAPGKTAELSVALGPLPMVSQMRFTLEPTYADGKAGPALPAAMLTLTPADGQQAPGHTSGHAGTGSATEDQQFAELVGQAEDDGGGFWSAAGWIVAALVGAAAVVALMRGRRRGAELPETPAAEPEPEDAGEPVAAGAKVSAWSYRGGP